jgi:hypothetical protein
MTAWRLEAAGEEYRLSSIMHADAAGSTCYWEHGQWLNSDFETVEAPEGISPEHVPYTLSGEWLGVPFANPGDAPSGTFPAHAGDPAVKAADYLPWPAEAEALYRNWAEGRAVPALPAARWETLESGDVLYTLTGVESWGVQAAHQCLWQWSDSEQGWQPAGEPVPGQMSFLAPAEMTDLFWEMPATDPELLTAFTLNRQNMLLQAGVSTLQSDRLWQMDNQGGMLCTRRLDENRTLTAEYDNDLLLQYDILTVDENGFPVSQTVFDAPEDAPDTYTLHLYYHYSENAAEEALWLRDIGWYSYETGKPCEGPAGVDAESAAGVRVE